MAASPGRLYRFAKTTFSGMMQSVGATSYSLLSLRSSESCPAGRTEVSELSGSADIVGSIKL